MNDPRNVAPESDRHDVGSPDYPTRAWSTLYAVIAMGVTTADTRRGAGPLRLVRIDDKPEDSATG
jgi:hypothetical protein